MAGWLMKQMKPRDIVGHPQVRKASDPRKQEELNASVKTLGILQPLLVMASGVLLAGHRRLVAALAAGLETVPVIVTDRLLSDSEIRVIQLTENMHRADLKPIEQVEGVEELARLNPDMTNKELAELLSFDPSMMTRMRSVSKVIPAAREALAAGRVGLSTVYAISKCESPSDQERMLAQALSGASRDAIEQAGRKSRNGRAPTVRLSRVKIAMPGGASVVIAGTALGMSEVVELLSDTLKEARKAAEQFDVQTFQNMMRDKARKR